MWGRAILLSSLLVSAPAQAADWWWFGLNGTKPARVLTYLDRESIAPLRRDAVQVWTLAIAEAALPNGEQAQATHYAVRCRARTFATLGRVAFDGSGSKLPLSDIEPSEFAAAGSGTIAESIVNFTCGRASGSELRVKSPVEHASGVFGEERPPQPTESAASAPAIRFGTGFFVSASGMVLTSYHVVAEAERVTCRTPDGALHPAMQQRVSIANDLALLHVEARPAGYLELAPAGSVRAGDRVFTLGYGAATYLGFNEPRFTEGTVSALSGRHAEDAWLQISVPVQPGNSGGPLVNEHGEVVGVIAAQAATDAFFETVGTLPQNINWAVKSDYALPLVGAQPAAPRRLRAEAIELVRKSLCLIVAEGPATGG